jgi:ribonuclease HI
MEIFTDGSCINYKNKIYAGYGIYIPKYNIKISKKLSLIEKTNNRAELYAIIKAIKYTIKKYKLFDIIINTDSEYCIKIFTYLAKKYVDSNSSNKPNYDLLIIIYDLLNNNKLSLKLNKVKAHSNNENNNITDNLAKLGSIKDIIFNNENIIYDLKINFGKYKNYKLYEINKIDKYYIKWLSTILDKTNIKNLLILYIIEIITKH